MEHQTKNLDLLSAWASEVVRNWACWALKRGTVAVGLEAQRRFEELHRRHLEVGPAGAGDVVAAGAVGAPNGGAA